MYLPNTILRLNTQNSRHFSWSAEHDHLVWQSCNSIIKHVITREELSYSIAITLVVLEENVSWRRSRSIRNPLTSLFDTAFFAELARIQLPLPCICGRMEVPRKENLTRGATSPAPEWTCILHTRLHIPTVRPRERVPEWAISGVARCIEKSRQGESETPATASRCDYVDTFDDDEDFLLYERYSRTSTSLFVTESVGTIDRSLRKTTSALSHRTVSFEAAAAASQLVTEMGKIEVGYPPTRTQSAPQCLQTPRDNISQEQEDSRIMPSECDEEFGHKNQLPTTSSE